MCIFVKENGKSNALPARAAIEFREGEVRLARFWIGACLCSCGQRIASPTPTSVHDQHQADEEDMGCEEQLCACTSEEDDDAAWDMSLLASSGATYKESNGLGPHSLHLLHLLHILHVAGSGGLFLMTAVLSFSLPSSLPACICWHH